MSKWYKLEGKSVIETPLLEAANFLGTSLASYKSNGVYVSTVFLALDHNYSGVGKPVVFETMIFGGDLNGTQVRYTDYDDAIVGHNHWVEIVRKKNFTIWKFFMNK